MKSTLPQQGEDAHDNKAQRRDGQLDHGKAAPVTTPGDVLAAARAWHGANFCVIPPHQDGTKAPLVSWKQYQTSRPSSGDMSEWYDVDTQYGIGLVCGKVSGNLEMAEVEGRMCVPEEWARIEAAIDAAGQRELWEFLCDGYSEWTPSGGLHLLYHVDGAPVPGNTKIASRPKRPEDFTDRDRETLSKSPRTVIMETLIETRGEGGYVVVAPSQGPVHPSGNPWTLGHLAEPGVVPTITWEQRNALVAALSVLDVPKPRQEAPPLPVAQPRPQIGSSMRVGDDFNARGDWGFLESAGWTVHPRQGAPGETFWVRPGKNWTEGHSASTGYAGDADRLYVWSSATEFPTEEPISRFAAYTRVVHNGDYRSATKDLSAQGYGEQRRPAVITGYQQFGNLQVPAYEATTDQAAAAFVGTPPPPSETVEAAMSQARRSYCQTSVGNAERLVDMVGKDFRYVPSSKSWMAWTGSQWIVDEGGWRVNSANTSMTYAIKGEVDQAFSSNPEGDDLKAAQTLHKWFQSSQMDRGMKGTLSQFSMRPEVAARAEQFDARTGYLNLTNGIYDLTNHVLLPHDRRFYMTKTFGAAYDPEASTDDARAFVEGVIPDPEMRRFALRMAGYSLLGVPDERAMMILHGPPRTGKSQFIEMLQGLFGDYGYTASAGALRRTEGRGDSASPGLHAMRGRRFVSTSETSQDAVLDEETIKRVTGLDSITSRALYQDEQTWTPQCVIWLATNHLPRLNSDDGAMFDRVKLIPFETKFTPDGRDGGLAQVKNLARKLLESNAPGVFNLILEGLKDYQAIGMAEPGQVTEAATEYQRELDIVEQFIADSVADNVIVESAEATIPSRNLYVMYANWIQLGGQRPMPQVRFANRMKNLKYVMTKGAGNGRLWIGLGTGIHGMAGTMNRRE